MEISKYYSPNYDKKARSSKSITLIIIHYTGMQSERESIKKLVNSKSKVSCHYLINRKGKIFNMVNLISKKLPFYVQVKLSISKLLSCSVLL